MAAPESRPPATPGDLMIDAIADAVVRKAEKLLVVKVRLMDIHAAAEYLGMTEAALRQKAGRDIACIRADGKLRFDRRDLDRWIEQAPREGV